VSGFGLLRASCAGVVALITAWSSYWHMVTVALRYGERSEVAYVLPLSVDGVLTVAAIVMADDRREQRPVRPVAKVAFVAGLAASVAANVAAAHPSLGGRLIAAWPAIALLLIVEMLVYVRPDAATPAQPGEASGEDRLVPDRPADVPRPRTQQTAWPRPDAGAVPEHAAGRSRRRPAVVTRQLAASIMAAEPDLTREQVAARIGISARRLRAVLTDLSEATGSMEVQQ